jgi:hypothetical protein
MLDQAPSNGAGLPARRLLTFRAVKLTNPKRAPCMVILIADKADEEANLG